MNEQQIRTILDRIGIMLEAQLSVDPKYRDEFCAPEKPPTMSITAYLHRLNFLVSNVKPIDLRRGEKTIPDFENTLIVQIIALFYLDRVIQKARVKITEMNIHRLLMATTYAAIKHTNDFAMNYGNLGNSFMGKIGGVSATEVKRLELALAMRLNFRFAIDVGKDAITFTKYINALEKHLQLEQDLLKNLFCEREGFHGSMHLLWDNTSTIDTPDAKFIGMSTISTLKHHENLDAAAAGNAVKTLVHQMSAATTTPDSTDSNATEYTPDNSGAAYAPGKEGGKFLGLGLFTSHNKNAALVLPNESLPKEQSTRSPIYRAPV